MCGNLGPVAGLDVVERAANRTSGERADAGADCRAASRFAYGVADQRADAGAGQSAGQRAAVGVKGRPATGNCQQDAARPKKHSGRLNDYHGSINALSRSGF
jgi:hypothetical protein